MGDVRGNTGGARQYNRCRSEPSGEFAADNGAIDLNRASDRPIFPERQLPSGYVAFDDAINMEVAVADDVAFDSEIIAQDRRGCAAALNLFSRLLGPHCPPLSVAFLDCQRLCRTNLSRP